MAVRLDLLGGFELRCEGSVVDLPNNARRVLAFLALHGRAASRIYVAGTLWPEATESRSRANLRTVIWTLQTVRHELILVSARSVRISERVEVDVHEAVLAAQTLIERPAAETHVRHLGAAGELLPDWYEDWVDRARERIRQLQLHALDAVATTALEESRYAAAAEACLLAIQLDDVRESSQRLMLRVHLAQGNVCDAWRLYTQYTSKLHSEYGLEPSSEMRSLGRSVEAVTLR